MRNSLVLAIVLCLSPLVSVAAEVRCADISGDSLKFQYFPDDHLGALSLHIVLPSKIGDAVFHSLRAEFSRYKKGSFLLDTKTNDKGEVVASIGVPYGHELLELRARYHYPQCYSFLEAAFASEKRVK